MPYKLRVTPEGDFFELVDPSGSSWGTAEIPEEGITMVTGASKMVVVSFGINSNGIKPNTVYELSAAPTVYDGNADDLVEEDDDDGPEDLGDVILGDDGDESDDDNDDDDDEDGDDEDVT